MTDGAGPRPKRLRRRHCPPGTVEVSAAYGRPDDAWATIAIAHGAGAGYRHPFLLGFARGMREEGVATLRFNFPYLEAGRRMPGPAAHADRDVDGCSGVRAGTLRRAAGLGIGQVVRRPHGVDGRRGGRGRLRPGWSTSATPCTRPATRRRRGSRTCRPSAQPQLFVEGTNDPFIDPHTQLEDAVASCQDATIAWIEGGGHSFEVKGRKRPADEIGAEPRTARRGVPARATPDVPATAAGQRPAA